MVVAALNEQLLDEKLVQLEKVRTWSPRVISKLEALIRGGTHGELFRLNPLRFAAAKGIAEGEAIDLFLYATKVGLFEMEWQLICPSCGHIVESLRELDQLHPHIMCASCYIETDLTLDDYIQISFTIA